MTFLLEGRARFDLVSWDHPHAPTPMPANLTPQEAVIRYKRRPANCDIVVVILASRIGTHLSLDALRRHDGTPYLSGTEWEYEDAWNASPQPAILVYRRMDVPHINPRDPDRMEKMRQYELVEQFFERFKNPDGSWRGGYQEYSGLDETKLANDVKHITLEHLRNIAPREDPRTDTAPIPPDRCLGRETETTAPIAALTARRNPAVLVLGGPGIGKTTLTRQVATSDALAARFAGRRWFVELETATDAASLRAAIVLAHASGHLSGKFF